MKTETLLFKILSLISCALAVAVIAVAIPLALRGDTEGDGGTGGSGDQSLYEYRVIYGPYSRSTPSAQADGTRDFSKNMKTVTVFTGKETYSLVHPKKEDGSDDYLSFLLSRGGAMMDTVTVGSESVSEMVAAFGSLFARLVTKENLSERYAVYGLEDLDTLPYFELTMYGKTLAEEGETLRIYIGKRAADGGGYYFRVAGEEGIFLSQTPTAGNLVTAGIEYFISPLLLPSLSETHYQLAESFRVIGETAVSDGRTVGEGDTVLVSETVRTVTRDGSGTVLSDVTEEFLSVRYALSSGVLSPALRAAIVGRTVGAEGDTVATVTATVPSVGGGTVTREETHTVHAVRAVLLQDTRIGIEFLYKYADRDEFFMAGLYRLTAPSRIVTNAANETVIQSVLSSLSTLTGRKTVKYGFTDSDRETYGLSTAVYLTLPREYTETEIKGSISSIEAKDFTVSGRESAVLYVSDPLPDGTRYVASTYTGLIATVEASAFDFLSYDAYDWVSRAMVMSYMDIVETLTVDLNFTDTAERYTFLRNQAVKTGDVYTAIPVLVGGEEKRLSYTAWQNFYLHLSFRSYGGVSPLTEEETEALLTEDALLSITFRLTDGRVFTYEMRAFSDRRALVTLLSEDGHGGVTRTSGFFLSTSAVKGIAEKAKGLVYTNSCTPDGIYG